LTRRRLRGSGDTGRPGRARSTRPTTANSSGQGAIDPQQEGPTAPTRGPARLENQQDRSLARMG
jgi:hypothetical protein